MKGVVIGAKRKKNHPLTLIFIGLAALVFAGIKTIHFHHRDPSAPGYEGRVIKRETQVQTHYHKGRQRETTERTLTIPWTDGDNQYKRRFKIDKNSFYNNHPEGSQVRLARYGDTADEVELVQPSSWFLVIIAGLIGALMTLFGLVRWLSR